MNTKPGRLGKSEAAEERAFNETLKRMLETPPKPHKDEAKSDDKQRPKDRERRE